MGIKMEEIEVNEYIRTKKGSIDKVINPNYYMSIYVECEKGMYLLDNVVKHSKILSEVVDVGDFVNEKLIHKIDKGPNYCYLYYGNCKTFVDYQIQTILTKEQFETNCYKVGGEE